MIDLSTTHQKIIIFSDLHKGNKKRSDDFAPAESNYLAALEYYYGLGYTLIILGDSEELWKYNLFTVRKHNHSSFELEKKFLKRKGLIKIFGNHDVFWNNDPFAPLQLLSIYGENVRMYEGLLLQYGGQKKLDIFLTHGHQGDGQSDGTNSAHGSWQGYGRHSSLSSNLISILRRSTTSLKQSTTSLCTSGALPSRMCCSLQGIRTSRYSNR